MQATRQTELLLKKLLQAQGKKIQAGSICHHD